MIDFPTRLIGTESVDAIRRYLYRTHGYGEVDHDTLMAVLGPSLKEEAALDV